jgi:hypothetical protein
MEFSYTSKMPFAPAWGLPARHCQTGSKLRNSKKLTPCRWCYACTGMIEMNAQPLLERNFKEYFKDGSKKWVLKMTWDIELKGCRYFRLFHSGDLQSVQMLRDIAKVATNLPYVKFWLPTQETKYVKEYIKQGGKIPENLNIRISSSLIDVVRISTIQGVTNSFVSLEEKQGFECLAEHQNGSCLTCRACWDKKESLVCYPLKVGRFYRPKSALRLKRKLS